MKRKKSLIFLLILVFCIGANISSYAAMQLYISDDCGNCELVMRLGKRAIERLKEKGELELVDVTRVKTDLPALPALVDGDKVIIGAGLIEHLADKAGINYFSNYAPLAIVGLGFLDGINPCAFATMVFFISFLTLNSYRKKQIAYIGSAFMLGVFLTYLALGLGIFQAFKKLRLFPLLSTLVYFIIMALTLGLGVYYLCDYLKFKRTGETKSCSLKLYNYLRQIADSRKTLLMLIVAAFVNGFIIALLESACTGQIYFPTIALISAIPNLNLRPLWTLTLYNIFFIAPLLLIFILALISVNSEKITQLIQKRLGEVKLLMSGLFFGLAAALICLKV